MHTEYKQLIDELVREGVLKTPAIIDAFKSVDRRNFVLPEHKDEAYADSAFPIGYGQTISQPYTVAFMLELLQPQKGDRILDIGSGSGWTTALLAHIVGKDGFVYGVERVPELVAFGKQNLAKTFFENAEITEAGETLGLPRHAPYKKILVSAADTRVPEELTEQLERGGILVIPVLGGIEKIEKDAEGETAGARYEGFRFVPLVYTKN